MSYTHLTSFERGEIHALLEVGKSKADIAEQLGRDRSTIYRELRRNSTQSVYFPQKAQQKYQERRGECQPAKKIEYPLLWRHVIDKIGDKIPPEAIAGRLPLDYPDDPKMRISHEAIYQAIYRDKRLHFLIKDLPQARPKRRKRGQGKTGRVVRRKGWGGIMSMPDRNPIEILAAQLYKRFPHGHVELDPPSNSMGLWYLDVRCNSQNVVVSWQVQQGFGISCATAHGYGEGSDEVYECLEAAYARVVSLLLSNEVTVPPTAVRLRDLRRMRGVSQEVLAATLDVRQASVSKLEHRNDVLVSSLRATIQAMGGELRITASFPDGMERIVEIGEDSTESS